MTDALKRQAMGFLAFWKKARRGWRRLTRPNPWAERTSFYKKMWEEAAASIDATVVDLGGSVLEVRRGPARIRVCDKFTSADDPVTIRVTEDRVLANRLFAENGVLVPRHSVFHLGDLEQAWSFVTSLGKPAVVKPARGSDGGNGVTGGVARKRDLASAMALAGAFCEQVIVEEEIHGDTFRLLYLDGVLLDAVRRHPLTVRGDGSSSLRRLISQQGGADARTVRLLRDRDMQWTLRRRGYSLRSVPRAGEVIRLRTVVRGTREENVRAVGDLCESVIRSGANAAAAVGARLAGVDLITTDPSLSLEQSHGAVIEVNTPPGLYYHYVTDKGSAPVARANLERLLSEEPSWESARSGV